MWSESSEEQTFNNLAYGIAVGDRSIIRRVGIIKAVTLDDRCHLSSFKFCGKDTFLERQIGKACDDS